jgi:hypothetical protein
MLPALVALVALAWWLPRRILLVLGTEGVWVFQIMALALPLLVVAAAILFFANQMLWTSELIVECGAKCKAHNYVWLDVLMTLDAWLVITFGSASDSVRTAKGVGK